VSFRRQRSERSRGISAPRPKPGRLPGHGRQSLAQTPVFTLNDRAPVLARSWMAWPALADRLRTRGRPSTALADLSRLTFTGWSRTTSRRSWSRRTILSTPPRPLFPGTPRRRCATFSPVACPGKEREYSGYLYFLDKEGDVSRAKMARGNKAKKKVAKAKKAKPKAGKSARKK